MKITKRDVIAFGLFVTAALPTFVGLLCRESVFQAVNTTIIASGGRANPQDVAETLSRGDWFLLIGLSVSVALFLLLVVVALTVHKKRWYEVVLSSAGALTLAFFSMAVWDFVRLNTLMGKDFVEAVANKSEMSEGEIAEFKQGVYSQLAASYQLDKPIHSSDQLASVSGDLRPEFEAANRKLNVGAWVGLVLLLVGLWVRWSESGKGSKSSPT